MTGPEGDTYELIGEADFEYFNADPLAHVVEYKIPYHYAYLTFHRYVLHRYESENELCRHARCVYYHAVQILLIVRQCLVTFPDPKYSFSRTRPLLSLAVLEAVDIVTAAGLICDIGRYQSRLLQLMFSGVEVLSYLAEHEKDAATRYNIAERRCRVVYSRISRAVFERKTAFYCTYPLVTTGPQELDLVYGWKHDSYLAAVRNFNEILSEKNTCKIDI